MRVVRIQSTTNYFLYIFFFIYSSFKKTVKFGKVTIQFEKDHTKNRFQ